MVNNKKFLGSKGENAVKKYLKDKGYKILESNFRTRYGEIDIIAVKDGILTFVEVKTRTTCSFGTPAEAVESRKQRQIRRMAAAYLAVKKGTAFRELRFDVAAVKATMDGTIKEIVIYEGAF